jgi:PIN domain nuclease of toxin-antitoxin system
MSRLLLDTHAALRVDADKRLSPRTRRAIERAERDLVAVSAITAFEVGTLLAKGRLRLKVSSAHEWFARFVTRPGVLALDVTWQIAAAAAALPGAFHGDPADRILVATARDMRIPLVTDDARILDYAAAGHVDAMPC